ncbi:MAG TPA: hypothetical protein VFS33_10805 [Gemmatimonadales bacterium]|nr:hypothetical protein [Gemmatimonadales bacterium]
MRCDHVFDVRLIGIAALLGYVAWRRNSRPLGLVAAFVGATMVAGVILMGWLAFALLFWI